MTEAAPDNNWFACRVLALALAVSAVAGVTLAQADDTPPTAACGEMVTLATHAGTTMRYALVPAADESTTGATATLVLLVGGGGYLNLSDTGCPQLLKRNSLVRMQPLLHRAGVATALVDAPSDMRSEDGLGGFRTTAEYAGDVAAVIADLRQRSRGPVWVAGHSRGSISAANAAARLKGIPSPDGLILLSAMMVGDAKARKPWVAQTVFSTDLESITSPTLILGHVADNCTRSPSQLMAGVAARVGSARRQVVVVSGGPIAPGRAPGLAACEVGEPHDFVGQDEELAAGILRFISGGNY